MRTRSHCPCCATLITTGIPTVLGGLSETSSYDEIHSTWIGVGTSRHFDYYQCSYCGTLLNSFYPDDSDLAILYSSMPPNMEEVVDEDDQVRNQSDYACHIASILLSIHDVDPAKVRYLELGADRGLLGLALSQSLGYRLCRSVAVEPNTRVWPHLNAALRHSSNESESYISLQEMKLAPYPSSQKYDAIAAIHVLDHAYDPFSVLQELASLLSENGIIFFVVHNPNSLVARLLGTRWPAYCAQHPQLFTPSGIRAIAARLGLNILRQGRTKNHFSLAMFTDFLGLRIPVASKLKICAPLGNRFYCLHKPVAQ